MGKSSKKSNTKVDVAPAVVAPTKPMKKGKREAEVAVEKASAKKQKKDSALQQAVEKKKAEAKVQKKKKVESSSSSEDDSSSDSEPELKKPAPKAVAAPKKEVAKNGKLASSSDSSDDDSSSDDEPAAKAPPPKGKSAPAKAIKKEDSSSDSSSDEEMPAAKKVPAPKGKSAPATSVKKEDSSSDSSDEDSSSDEDMPAAKKAPAKKKDSSSSEEESDEDEDTPAAKKVPAAKKKDSSSSEEESDEDEDTPAAKKVPAAKNGTVKGCKAESSSEEDSSTDEDVPVVKKATPSAPAPAKKAENSSDESDSSDESEDEDPQKKKSTTVKKSSSDEDSSEEEESDEEDEPSKTPKKDADVKMVDAFSTDGKKSVQKTPVTPKGEALGGGSKTLFMGNLSWNIEQADVENFFKDVGEVQDVRFASHPDGQFKGFGHVEFATSEAAVKALELNGQQLLGRDVKLDLAKERGAYTPNENSFQKQGRSAGGGDGTTVFVRGFDKNNSEDQIRSSLEEHFGSCGDIKSTRLPTDPEGNIKGMAYIEFTDSDAMNKALELNDSQLGNYSLYVDEAKPRGDGGGSGRGGFSSGRGDRGRGRGRGDRGRGRGDRGRGRGFGRTPNKPSMTFSTGKKTTFDD